MLYEDNEGLVRLQVDVDDNGGDDVNFDDGNDDGDDDDTMMITMMIIRNVFNIFSNTQSTLMTRMHTYQKQNATK